MVVQSSRSFIEAAGVPGIREVEVLEVEVMAEFVGQGAEESAKGCDFFAYCGSHPYTNEHRARGVIAKQFRSPVFTNSQRSGSENANAATGHLVEL